MPGPAPGPGRATYPGIIRKIGLLCVIAALDVGRAEGAPVIGEAVREILGAARHQSRRLRYRRALAKMRVSVPVDGIRVSYGDVLPPGVSGAIRGGA